MTKPDLLRVCPKPLSLFGQHREVRSQAASILMVYSLTLYFSCTGKIGQNAGRCYCALLKPMLSGTTVAGPTGNNSAGSMLSLVNAIFSLHTFLRRSLKKPTVRNSPAQRRYPKPNGAYPASSHTG